MSKDLIVGKETSYFLNSFRKVPCGKIVQEGAYCDCCETPESVYQEMFNNLFDDLIAEVGKEVGG